MNKKSAVLLLILVLVLAFVIASGRQLLPADILHGDQLAKQPRAYVFLINKSCDYEYTSKFASDLQVFQSGYEKYITGEYQTMCFGGITDLWLVDQVTVPVMRFFYPETLFIFVYPKEMAGDFNKYIAYHYGYKMAASKDIVDAMRQGLKFVSGFSNIEKGTAFAEEHPHYVEHEMGHLMVEAEGSLNQGGGYCGTWHGPEGESNILPIIQRYPSADNYPWCRINQDVISFEN